MCAVYTYIPVNHTHRQAGRQESGQTNRQAGRQTDRQTDKHTDRQAGRHTDRQTHGQAGRHTDRQTHGQAGRHTDRPPWLVNEGLELSLDLIVGEEGLVAGVSDSQSVPVVKERWPRLEETGEDVELKDGDVVVEGQVDGALQRHCLQV